MTIAFVTHDLSGVGGIQQLGRYFVRALEDLGHNCIEIGWRARYHWLQDLYQADRIIVFHRHLLPVLLFRPWLTSNVLVLFGIDAEPPCTWLERLALRHIKEIWVISYWTAELAGKFGKPVKVIYPCGC